jgi:carbon storage regulator
LSGREEFPREREVIGKQAVFHSSSGGVVFTGRAFIQRERVSMAGLVLSRKQGEAIEIGDKIVVTVVELTSGKVRLHVKAPIEVMVHRKEVADAIRRGEEP